MNLLFHPYIEEVIKISAKNQRNKQPVALIALLISAFAIGTTEFVIMGILPDVGNDLNITLSAAGLLVTGYAQVVASSIFDNTLPKGRPQGTEGLAFASRNFRIAVPDLQCTIEDLVVSADKVTARLSFNGTYKGEFMGKTPTGKPVHFFTIDILNVRNGKVVEDWHLEDNLTLMQQLGVVSEN